MKIFKCKQGNQSNIKLTYHLFMMKGSDGKGKRVVKSPRTSKRMRNLIYVYNSTITDNLDSQILSLSEIILQA